MCEARTEERAEAGDAPDTAAHASVDCDEDFPSYADGRQVTDFGPYAALVANDLIPFLGDDTLAAKQLEDLADKPYQLQKLKRVILSNKALKASFKRCRDQVSKVPLYYLPADDTGHEEASSPLKFIGGEFRFIIGCGLANSDKAALTMLLGSGERVQMNDTVILDDVSAMYSPRVRCWPDEDDPFERCCGLSLKGMPARMKDVIEDEFGKTIAVRWRWKGFGSPTKAAYGAMGGDLRFGVYRMTVRAPSEVELQFIDSDGGVLWGAK